MRYQMTGVAMVACCFAMASAQTSAPQNVDRVFHLTQKETTRDLNELATTLRAAVLRGNAAEVGLADWLMQKLDLPGQNQAPQEYPFAGLRGPEVARVFYLLHTQSPRDIQEIMTTLRSVADLQRIFVYLAPK